MSAVPRALTHSAALNMANQAGRSAAMPNNTGTPQSAGVIGAPQGVGYSHSNQQNGTVQSKMTIPKSLPPAATQHPTPVNIMTGIPNARPTYTGGGPVSSRAVAEPAMGKVPAYVAEGEGERVLNKKKLDELARQVCGGTNKDQDGKVLEPEVEEVMDSAMRETSVSSALKGTKD